MAVQLLALTSEFEEKNTRQVAAKIFSTAEDMVGMVLTTDFRHDSDGVLGVKTKMAAFGCIRPTDGFSFGGFKTWLLVLEDDSCPFQSQISRLVHR